MPRSTRGSACRRWRRLPAAARSSAATLRRSRRSSAMPPSCVTPTTWGIWRMRWFDSWETPSFAHVSARLAPGRQRSLAGRGARRRPSRCTVVRRVMGEIGLSGLPLDYPHSGSAVYARELFRRLPEVTDEFAFHLFLRQAPFPGNTGVSRQRVATPFARLNRGHRPGARLDKLTWETIALPLAAAVRQERLIHVPYFAAPFVSSIPVVVTVHDVIPLVLKGYHRSRQSAAYSRTMGWTVRRARAVITVSHYSKQDIVRALRIPDERVWVTHEAVDGRFRPTAELGEREAVRASYNLPSRYFL